MATPEQQGRYLVRPVKRTYAPASKTVPLALPCVGQRIQPPETPVVSYGVDFIPNKDNSIGLIAHHVEGVYTEVKKVRI